MIMLTAKKHQRTVARPKKYSISRRLTISLILAAALVSAAASAVNYYITMSEAQQQLELKADEYCELIADALRMPLWALHTDSIKSVGTSYAQNEFIAGLKIFDSDDAPYFEQKLDDTNGPFLSRVKKIYYKNEYLGSVEVAFSRAQYQKNLARLLTASIVAALAILGTLTLITGSLLRRFLGVPLRNLSAQVDAYAFGHYALPHADLHPVEFSQFISVLHDMGRTIEQQMDTLKDAEKKYRSLIETLNDCVWETDAQGVFTYISPRYEDLLGYKTRAMLGKSRFSFMPEEESQMARERFELCVAQGRPFSGLETSLLDTNGKSLRIEYNGVPIFDGPDKKLVGLRGVDRDISERKARERAERDRNAAEAAAQARSVFLDNSGQGFLSFGTDLIVEPEYSKECLHIFKKSIDGESIVELLFPDDAESQATLEKNFKRIFESTSRSKQRVLLSLLRKEYRLEGTFVEAEYRLVADKMMLILTDVTRRKELENEIIQERNRLKFVVSTVRDSQEFFTTLDDFDTFRKEDLHGMTEVGADAAEILSVAYRMIHTFKGNFAQQDFLFTPQALHTLENRLARLLKQSRISLEDIARIQNDLREFTALDLDLEVIEEFLGQEFLQQRGVVIITEAQAARLEAMANRLLDKAIDFFDAESLELLAEIRNIRSVNFKDLLAHYPKAACELAERFEKMLHPFEIEGEDFYITPDDYIHFTKSLVHVFRNAVDHGLETPDERIELGKDPAGTLHCEVGREKDAILVRIEDDGRGIDTQHLRTVAVERGVLSQEQADAASESELMEVIFEMGFSTRESVTTVSGRGVGLSAVKKELDALGGTIAIESHPGKGTSLLFTLPVER